MGQTLVDDKRAVSAVAKLRTLAAKQPIRGAHKLLQHPDVAALIASESPAVHAAARAKLVALTAGAKLAGLAQAEHVHVMLLVNIVNAHATESDLDMVFRVFGEGPDVARDPQAIRKHGASAQRYFLSRLGKPNARHQQSQAAMAALQLEPELAISTFEKIATAKRLPERAEETASEIIGALALTKTRPTRRWVNTLIAVAKRHPHSYLCWRALDLLAEWKQPKLLPLAITLLEKQPRRACDVFETIGDRAAIPALQAALAILPANDRRSRGRVERCIGRLAKRRKPRSSHARLD